jgi:siderophore-iron reductase FhuF
VTDAPVLCQTDLDAILRPHQQALGAYSNRLYVNTLPADMEIVPATAFLDGPVLEGVLRTAADRLRAPDLCVAASLWNKYYNAAVVPGLLAAMTLGGIGLDGSLAHASLALRDGLPHALVIHDAAALVYQPRLSAALTKTVPGQRVADLVELQRTVVAGAFERHLRLVIEQIHALTHLSRQILWSNVANLCAALYDRLAEASSLTALVQMDRALLEQAECPGLAGPNPMHGMVWYERSADSCGITRVRQRCCLRYRLPQSTPCADICPLLKRPERRSIEYNAVSSRLEV